MLRPIGLKTVDENRQKLGKTLQKLLKQETKSLKPETRILEGSCIPYAVIASGSLTKRMPGVLIRMWQLNYSGKSQMNYKTDIINS